MLLQFHGSIDEVREGLDILLPELNVMEGEGGVFVDVSNVPGGLTVGLSNGNGYIQYEKKNQFFRALGLFIEKSQECNSFKIVETMQFSTIGAMFDCSRNAVLNISTIKYFIRKLALMGINLLMLYTEDTYEVPDEPYFGYLRGRYSYKEMKSYDDYANIFGVEIVPCMQTLAHLEQFLKWPAINNLRDTEGILLTDYETTYALIEKLIRAVSSPLRSKRIHIGMDEAHMLGLGRHLQIYGYEKPFDIMERHILKILEITGKLGLKPMMWSDMFFSVYNNGRGYYNLDLEIPDDTIQRVPKGITQVYYDYYHKDENFYIEYICKHKRLGHMPIFAGGICTYGAMIQNWCQTYTTTMAALAACKKEGVSEVFATIWNDGGECNYLSTLLGLQLWAELGYSSQPDIEKISRRFTFCCGVGYNAFYDLCTIDLVDGRENGLHPPNPSKYLLWQDVLLGLFDSHLKDDGILEDHYRSLSLRLGIHIKRECIPPELIDLFKQIKVLCTVLELKCTIGRRIHRAYGEGNKTDMAAISYNELPRLRRLVGKLRDLHRQNWFKIYKPFGWEVLDIRYGGLLARIESAENRLNDFITGRIEKIPELEEEILTFDGIDDGNRLGFFNRYSRIATPNALG